MENIIRSPKQASIKALGMHSQPVHTIMIIIQKTEDLRIEKGWDNNAPLSAEERSGFYLLI